MAGNDERQGRATAVAAERRRRGDTNLAVSKKLAIPPEIQAKLDAEGLTPRWVNDERNRVHNLTTRDDYDRVEGVEPVLIGKDEDGQPIKAILLAKRTEYLNEDRAKAEERRRGVEQSLVRGAVPTVGPNQRPAQAGDRYVVSGTEIGRGNQILD